MSESRWGRLRRSKRAEEEFRSDEDELDELEDDEDPRPPLERAAPPRPVDPEVSRPIPALRPGGPPTVPRRRRDPGVEALFANEDAEENEEPPRLREGPADRPPRPDVPAGDDPIRDALRTRTPADTARDELAALLASAGAQAEPERPAARDQGAETPEPPRERTPYEALTSGTSESWDAIESLFNRPATPGQETREESPGLQLDWERPEMFTEPTQEEILRRIGEVVQGMEALHQRIEDLARPLSEITEPGTRLVTAFKRLELIERSFEEMRLQSERNTLKTSSALSSLDTALGELRAAMEEPMWEMSERLTSAEIRLTELQGNERLVEQLNVALAKDPFDLVSTRDIEEITESITTKVKRLGSRVDRLEAVLDRGLSGLEESRRAALSAAKEMNKVLEKTQAAAGRAAPARGEASASTGTKPAKKTSARKSKSAATPAKRTARKAGS